MKKKKLSELKKTETISAIHAKRLKGGNESGGGGSVVVIVVWPA